MNRCWFEYSAAGVATEKQWQCIEAIRLDLRHRRYDSYEAIVAAIDEHVRYHGDTHLLPYFLRGDESAFTKAMMTAKQEISELLALTEVPVIRVW